MDVRGELRDLALGLPVPAASWHPHVAAILRVREDLLAALDALEGEEAELERLLAGGGPLPRPDDAALADAWAALEALPVPAGQHPFLAEILPVLEAAGLALAALAVSPAARRRFDAGCRLHSERWKPAPRRTRSSALASSS